MGLFQACYTHSLNPGISGQCASNLKEGGKGVRSCGCRKRGQWSDVDTDNALRMGLGWRSDQATVENAWSIQVKVGLSCSLDQVKRLPTNWSSLTSIRLRALYEKLCLGLFDAAHSRS
jgi:hypothetical protein